MKFSSRATLAMLGSALAAAFAGLTVAAAGLTANAAPSHQDMSAARVAVYDCTSNPEVRPAAFDICCDGSRSLIKLSWSSWNLSEAAGTGVYCIDTCPSCPKGKWQHQDVVMVLWRPTPVAHHVGQYGYSKMTLLYPATGQTETITLPSY